MADLRVVMEDGRTVEYVSGVMNGPTESGDLSCDVTVAVDGVLQTIPIVIPRADVLAVWKDE